MGVWWMFGVPQEGLARARCNVEVFAWRKDDLGLEEGGRGMRYGWRVSEVAKQVI